MYNCLAVGAPDSAPRDDKFSTNMCDLNTRCAKRGQTRRACSGRSGELAAFSSQQLRTCSHSWSTKK